MNKTKLLVIYQFIVETVQIVQFLVVCLSLVIINKEYEWYEHGYVSAFVIVNLVSYVVMFMITLNFNVNTTRNIYYNYPNYGRILIVEPITVVLCILMSLIMLGISNMEKPENDICYAYFVLSVFIAPIITISVCIYSAMEICRNDKKEIKKEYTVVDGAV
jgi:hypothetical protein